MLFHVQFEVLCRHLSHDYRREGNISVYECVVIRTGCKHKRGGTRLGRLTGRLAVKAYEEARQTK